MSLRPLALVTGASAGIGKELARVLAADHDLVLTARRADQLHALAAELRQDRGASCHVFPIDLADPAGPRALFDAVSAANLAVDVLVNNAGFGYVGPFAGADLARMLRMIQVNVVALTELTGLFLPGMRARGRGKILNVGSVAGFQPGPFMTVYYATKAFVNSFSEALSEELRGMGITVTCLAPGPTTSEFGEVSGMAATKMFTLGKVMGARPVAEAGVRGMKRGQRMVVTGLRNKLLVFFERFAPRGLVIRIVRWMQERRVPDGQMERRGEGEKGR
ncbi:MAG TPA: SDR family oxidoreductase [Gemmataceae bacterium]|nr:SDR family oxidoreductase [Gemmataceae bacterium]